jgi:hypothetical protein
MARINTHDRRANIRKNLVSSIAVLRQFGRSRGAYVCIEVEQRSVEAAGVARVQAKEDQEAGKKDRKSAAGHPK